MLNIATNYNVLIDKREYYYASSECPTCEYFGYLAKICPSYNMIYCPVTSPFISSEDYDNIIQLYNHKDFNNNYDSITTTEELNEFIYVEKETIII